MNPVIIIITMPASVVNPLPGAENDGCLGRNIQKDAVIFHVGAALNEKKKIMVDALPVQHIKRLCMAGIMPASDNMNHGETSQVCGVDSGGSAMSADGNTIILS